MGSLTMWPVAGLVTMGDLRGLLGGVSKTRADQISRYPSFPKPIQQGPRLRIWDRDEVIAWIETHRPSQEPPS